MVVIFPNLYPKQPGCRSITKLWRLILPQEATGSPSHMSQKSYQPLVPISAGAPFSGGVLLLGWLVGWFVCLFVCLFVFVVVVVVVVLCLMVLVCFACWLLLHSLGDGGINPFKNGCVSDNNNNNNNNNNNKDNKNNMLRLKPPAPKRHL